MKRIPYAFLAAVFFSLAAYAQNNVPPPPLDDTDVVKISTTLIQIDVAVTDKKGKPVRDLKPEEVEVYENGRKQNITNFTFVSGENQTTRESTSENRTNIPLPPPSIIRPEQVRRTIALVVDDMSLSFESVHFVRRALKIFVDKQMRDGDLVAIIRTGAGVGALQQFTTDKRQLYAAIDKVRWNPRGTGGVTAIAPLEPLDFESGASFPAGGAPPEIEEQEEGIDAPRDELDNFRESVFTVGTLGAINFIVRGMGDLPGRKSIMLFSDGMASLTGGEGTNDRVLSAIRNLIELANRASVVIYATDARGLQPTGITAADNVMGRTAQQIARVPSDRGFRLFETREGLIYLAEETGGLALFNTNDLSEAVRRMLDDQSYYLVAYEPDEEIFDPAKRRFNKLEVKVKRPNTDVRYRSGFFGVSDEQIAEKPEAASNDSQKILRAISSPFVADDIELRLNAVFGSDEKTGAYIHSFLHIDGENLAFKELPNGKKQAVFDIVALQVGDNGITVDSIGKTFTATVDEKRLLDIKRRGMIYDFVFPAKTPGAYQLRVAIHDKENGKLGSANQFIEVPDLKKKRLALSGIILENIPFEVWEKSNAGQDTSRRSNPLDDTTLRQFKPGTVLNYGLIAYNPKRDANGRTSLTGYIRVFRDGKVYFTGTPKPFNVISANAQKTHFGGSLNLGENMPAGEYVLQIVITDNLAKKKRQTATQFVPFDIIN